MTECIGGCGRALSVMDPILYDVFPTLPEGVDPATRGPYCESCFQSTASAEFLASLAAEQPHDPGA